MTGRDRRVFLIGGVFFLCLWTVACGQESSSARTGVNPGASPAATGFPEAPPATTTGGFDGARAYKHVEQLVALGPHSAGTEAIHRAQSYILDQLKHFGCPVEEQNFHALTPVGDVQMKNIVAKIPSSNPNIVMFASHYDTKRLDKFVGADDGGSSTGVLLELARLLCARKNAVTLWLVFFDGEEAFDTWSATDGTYGSREMAARLALSGELPHLRAMILVDMIGPTNLRIKRESNSTPWLTDLIWSTAKGLGYGNVFINDSIAVEDDHTPFLQRDVPASDLIDFDVPFWHTSRDTLDKIDPRSLSIVGHVLIESLPELEKQFR
jgi:Zn-dependent M28 family amino/carboxypeptidase